MFRSSAPPAPFLIDQRARQGSEGNTQVRRKRKALLLRHST
jgi:hypothetical protein